MIHTPAQLCGGVLAACFERVKTHFYTGIDEQIHASVYSGCFDTSYAEPEFTGKFMDICACRYERDGDICALNKGMAVVNSIAANIRADGYLGCLEAGNECKAFSVWNHGFTLYGLTRMYEATNDASILALVRRAADWIVNTFTGDGAPDILEASNKGSQHISCIYAMCRAFMATNDQKYLDFITKVLSYCETTDMNLLSFSDILSLRSQKGIEMLVVYLGVLTYGRLTNNSRATDAAKRYFEQVMHTQIRNTGNGTIFEKWTANGNAPRLMPTEEKPNETCVAVGITELALALFDTYESASYLDVIEKTLYNHMLGSLEKSGSDFAYYQGNYGQKIFRTEGGMYQCCRYRGFTLFSYLNDCLYQLKNRVLTPILYAPSRFCADGILCEQTTDYPANGTITFSIQADAAATLRLRIPAWCQAFTVAVKGVQQNLYAEKGFVQIPLPIGKTSVTLTLDMPLIRHTHIIDEKPYCSFTHGPLLLAHDTHYGGTLWQTLPANALLTREPSPTGSIVAYRANALTLVDFASAGSNAPELDRYTVFIPTEV